ncbi:sterol regulatory element-binding protein cleavage-activating protein-like [Topomyia yanbarensis]|uniref:sterol regulatory element-binding protein cleavage-activating protein-like n=1 Tax=Topomyia yanbarensis TaxID=2498891 RepID=UPI00273BFE8E|nr:sterol regulatory element-binding protein cleavage-activating protein-like [Topomyia yanbarensis]
MCPGVSPAASPVTCLEVASGTVMTGSQGHTFKVFRLDSHLLQFTLNGYCGPITCIFIDQWQAEMGASGYQDGVLCVWDLIRGACMCKIEATKLTTQSSHLPVPRVTQYRLDWTNEYGSGIDFRVVWDDNTGDVAREVRLDCSNSQLNPKIMLPASGSVICDYGNRMRIVRFPLVAAEKLFGPGNRNRPAVQLQPPNEAIASTSL